MTNIPAELRASMENCPYSRLLGLRLLELAEGYAKVAVKLGPEHANFLGGVNGGLILSLADYGFACSCNTLGQVRVAVQFNMNFLSAPAFGGDLRAEARTVHAGKTIVLAEISITDTSGKLVAKATGTGITRPSPGAAKTKA